jgi:8-oxo-dGTP pyrophosphatase MutT (NUDIX family)
MSRKGFDYPGVSVTFFCHDGQGNFLMQKRGANARDENGRWDIGSGGLDLGVTVEETLRKEIEEEYGTVVLDFEFLGFCDIFREHNGEKNHWLQMAFKVLIDPALAKNGEPHKFDEVKWFRLETLPEPSEMHSQFPNFIAKYGDRL